MSLDLLYSVTGLLGGIISTALMTFTEIPSWRKWGLQGVFEWHENQIITSRLLGLSDDKEKKKNDTHFSGIFFFHFLNGSLAGIAFPFIIIFFFSGIINNVTLLLLLGVVYGFILWIITLVPIHKPITGLSPWNHPLGRMPALASLGGHIVYGFALGSIIFTFHNLDM